MTKKVPHPKMRGLFKFSTKKIYIMKEGELNLPILMQVF